jgi:hypothetical protein
MDYKTLYHGLIIVGLALLIVNLLIYIYLCLYPKRNIENMLPDGLSEDLGSVPSGTEIDYVGAKLTSRGLQSHLKALEGGPKIHSDKEFKKAINAIFGQYKPPEKNKAGFFEEEMEGLKASNMEKNRNSVQPSHYVKNLERDGYGDRDPNAW